jgi:hypothetical protein
MSAAVKDILRATDIGRSGSSILNQLQWTTAILVAGILSLVFAKSPCWLLILFAVLLTSNLGLFWYAYIYFARKKHEALRSEKFEHDIAKLEQEMEKLQLHARATEIERGSFAEIADATKLTERSKKGKRA